MTAHDHLDELRRVRALREKVSEREAVLLRRLWSDGASDEEVAAALGCSVDAAKKRRHRGHDVPHREAA